jgi:hypothetical protein
MSVWRVRDENCGKSAAVALSKRLEEGMRQFRRNLIFSCLPTIVLAAFAMAERTPIATAQTSNEAPSGSAAPSGTSSAITPIAVAAATEVATGKVVAVDDADRTVVLQGDNGREITMQVGKDAKNFDQIKAGDTVKAQFMESAAVSVRKADEPPSASESQLVELAPRGAQPGGVIVDTQQITATVDNVDYQTRTVTVTGPRANTESFKVSDTVKNLNQVKQGDQVVLHYTQAVALSVEKGS